MIRKRHILVLAAALVCAGILCRYRAEEVAEQPAAKKAFGPQPQYVEIAKKIATMLPALHLRQFVLDEALSCRAWTNLLNSYDPDHSYFLQSDIEKFAQMETQMASALKVGNILFGYEIHQAFLCQLENRYAFVTNELAKEITFTADESYTWKRKDVPWPATEEERDTLWRKRVKNELLAKIIGKEMDAKVKQAEAAPENKEPPREENGAKKEDAVVANAAPILDPPAIVIGKRYKNFLTVMQDMDEEEVLQRYFNAFAMAFDPHTDYMSPAAEEKFKQDMELSLIGIGALLQPEDGTAMIKELIPGGPAARDTRDIRLCVGDKIIGVGQGDEPIEDILHWPLNKAIRKIRGKSGTKVVLEVIPASDSTGTTLKHVDLIREEIKLEDQAATGRVVRATLENGAPISFGIVKLPSFYGTMDRRQGTEGFRSATEDVARILADFNGENISGLILDLRNNGGGALREAVSLTGLFIRNGPVVLVKELTKVTVLPVQSTAMAFRKPMIVLINRASASASEIVAGALQDYGRAVIVGDTQSHGKGTVQTVFPLDSDTRRANRMGSLKLTTSSFYRITGGSTQIKGVASDIVIPSLLDGLDIGEDKLPGALPWTQTDAAHFMPVADVASLLPTLRAKSAERLKDNAKYTRYCTLVRHVQEVSQRTDVPLEINARRQMMKAEEEIRKLDEDDEDTPTGRTKKAKEEENIVLDEAVNILRDLVELMGDKDLPMETDGDWLLRMQRLIK